MDVGDADRIEELVEIASAFLSDLGGQRGLVVHGDEENSTPVLQTFFGLSYEEIDNLLFHFNDVAERYVGVYSDRGVLMATLRDAAGDCLGWLYVDSPNGFSEEAFDKLDEFARKYISWLLEICVLRPALPRRRRDS